MSIATIESIIAAANNELYEPLPFETGRAQDINLFSDNTGTSLLWLITPNSSLSPIGLSARFSQNYSVELFVFSSDDPAQRSVGADKDTSLDMIKEAEGDAVAIAIAIKDNADAFNLQLANITITPVYKYSARGVFTGVSLTMNITIPDQNEFC